MIATSCKPSPTLEPGISAGYALGLGVHAVGRTVLQFGQCVAS